MKNPSAQHLNDYVASMGKDHQKFDSKAMSLVGMDASAAEVLGENHKFALPSYTQEEKRKIEVTDAELSKAAEEKKEAPRTKLLSKEFDEVGVRTVMGLAQREVASKLCQRATTLQK